MSQIAIFAIVVPALIALAIRTYAARRQRAYIRWTWGYLRRTSHGDERTEPRETLVERAGLGIGSTRLLGVFSVMIAAFGIVLALDFIESGYEVVMLCAMAFGMGIAMIAIDRMFLPGLGPDTQVSEEIPKWLVDNDSRVPAQTAIGGGLWELALRAGRTLSNLTRMPLPQTYLVEGDDHLFLAVGESEWGAIAEDRQNVDPDLRMEREMIRAIQRLDVTLVREVMRPLNNVTAVSINRLNRARFLQIARKTGYTRFPCYVDEITNLIGYLNVHDFLESTDKPRNIRAMVHEAPFIPEVAEVDAALAQMQRARSQIAICFDEFGGCSGLLSREDIVEEITGEIMDEYDRPEGLKLQKRRTHWLAEGTIDLDHLVDAIGLELEKSNCDTLAGYIYLRLGRVPKRGEALEERGWKIEIAQMDKHRIRKVRLIPPADSRAGDEE